MLGKKQQFAEMDEPTGNFGRFRHWKGLHFLPPGGRSAKMTKQVPSARKKNPSAGKKSVSAPPPVPPPPEASGTAWAILKPRLAPCFIFILSACLLCCNLGARYLWQDEAATAVLAQRMMSSGRPLAYDGRNLITMDIYSAEEEPRLPTGDPKEAIQYYVKRGDFKADTTWIGQPWGQFVLAGISLALFGHNTIAARLPFVLAGALTTALLFWIVRRRLSSPSAAWVAAALVLSNPFWIMHIRQCRYYALSSLMLLVTLEAFLRWKEGRRWGGLLFIAAAWIWFQVDFGSLWPVLVILGLEAVISRSRRIGETALVFAGFCAVTVPFGLYYEIAGRLKAAAIPFPGRFWGMLFQLNQFQLPLVLIPAALCLMWINRRARSHTQPPPLVVLSLAAACTLAMWMVLIGPFPFYRYIVPVTTLSAIVTAYVVVELAGLIPSSKGLRWLPPSAVASAALLLAITNLLSWPVALLVPPQYRVSDYLSSVVRPEIGFLLDDLGNTSSDPNRAAVEFLREHVKPDDEILCNYEDIPLMFYLPNKVRGGLPCFRINDGGEPAFAVYRKSVFFHLPVYSRIFRKNLWRTYSLNAPDIAWGNNPDPRFHFATLQAAPQSLEVYERAAR